MVCHFDHQMSYSTVLRSKPLKLTSIMRNSSRWIFGFQRFCIVIAIARHEQGIANIFPWQKRKLSSARWLWVWGFCGQGCGQGCPFLEDSWNMHPHKQCGRMLMDMIGLGRSRSSFFVSVRVSCCYSRGRRRHGLALVVVNLRDW